MERKEARRKQKNNEYTRLIMTLPLWSFVVVEGKTRRSGGAL
jgi:hypothetical protein